jgi:ribonuclease J
MTTITVLAGERTIGGTQIVVEDQGARLLFDCGLAYDPAGDPFAQVQRRPGRVLSDLLALGLAPAVPGLYGRDHLSGTHPALPAGDGPLAVALSHSHLDHTHLVGFVDPGAPVYCSPPTARIVETLGVLGKSLGPAGRELSERGPEDWWGVGPLRARLAPVDHDVAGARGLLIYTAAGVIAYSGDLRLHGSAPHLSLAFAQAARDAGARLLILEGTRVRPPAPVGRLLDSEGTQPQPAAIATPEDAPVQQVELAEAEVAPLVADTLRGVPDQLGVIVLTPEHGARVEALAAAMASIGRLLVLDPDGLAFATAALGRPLAAPAAVYVPRALERQLEQELGATATRLREVIAAAPGQVTAQDIAANPGSILLRLDWPYFADLLDLVQPERGGVVFHANGLPLGPFDPAWRQLEWWVARLGLRLVQAGSSGHATPADLIRIARESGAPVVMAVHSHYPELLDTGRARLLLPARGQPYDLDRLV